MQSQLYDVKAQLADDELVATEARNSLPINTTLTNPLLNSNSLIQLKSILITISII